MPTSYLPNCPRKPLEGGTPFPSAVTGGELSTGAGGGLAATNGGVDGGGDDGGGGCVAGEGGEDTDAAGLPCSENGSKRLNWSKGN